MDITSRVPMQHVYDLAVAALAHVLNERIPPVRAQETLAGRPGAKVATGKRDVASTSIAAVAGVVDTNPCTAAGVLSEAHSDVLLNPLAHVAAGPVVQPVREADVHDGPHAPDNHACELVANGVVNGHSNRSTNARGDGEAPPVSAKIGGVPSFRHGSTNPKEEDEQSTASTDANEQSDTDGGDAHGLALPVEVHGIERRQLGEDRINRFLQAALFVVARPIGPFMKLGEFGWMAHEIGLDLVQEVSKSTVVQCITPGWSSSAVKVNACTRLMWAAASAAPAAAASDPVAAASARISAFASLRAFSIRHSITICMTQITTSKQERMAAQDMSGVFFNQIGPNQVPVVGSQVLPSHRLCRFGDAGAVFCRELALPGGPGPNVAPVFQVEQFGYRSMSADLTCSSAVRFGPGRFFIHGPSLITLDMVVKCG